MRILLVIILLMVDKIDLREHIPLVLALWLEDNWQIMYSSSIIPEPLSGCPG